MASGVLQVLLLLIAWGIPQDCAGQRYAILAPRTVRPHSTYDLTVSNIGIKRESFLCEIVTTNDTVVGSTSVDVKPDELQKVEISLGVLRAGSYRLKVLEQAKRTLLNTTELEYIDRSYLVLFQTDKPAYKPGDLVQFRILFLTTDTKPVGQSVQPTIFIIDPERIRMKQWIDVSLTSGVFEGSFRLAEYTSLGRWTITATVNQQLYKDTFSVEEYTLPLFRVQVESVPKPYFQCDVPNMTLKLRATFVHGGSVQGNALVVVRANYNNYPSQTKEVARRELPINGTAVVEFPTDLIARSCVEERNVWFYVTVTESATGVSYSTTCANTVHIAGGVVMEVLDGNEAFYPGSAMRLMVKLATVDKKPLVNQQVVIGYKVLEEDHIDMEEVVPGVLVLQTNANGIVRFAINTTLNTVAVNVEGVYRNQTFPLINAYPMYEDRSLEYLAISTRQAYYVVHQNISIDIHSNVKIQKFYYVAYCRGKVCESGVQQSPTPVYRHRLVFTARPPMVPQIKLLAFAVKQEGKILSSTIIVRFQSASSRALNITANVMEPNSDRYFFNVMAEKNAFVGLLGVDERVLQRVTSDNDITQEKLEKALQSAEDTSAVWSTYDSFGSAGVQLLTDGYLPDVGFVPHRFDDLARSSSTHSEEESVRKDFPETWLWESFTASNGIFSLERSLPDTITTWTVSGFSVGPVNGLQILKRPLEIKSKKRIFAQLHTPPSIKRFEEVIIHCLVHNYGKAMHVLLEVHPALRPTALYLAEEATASVPVRVRPTIVGVLTLKVILTESNNKVLDVLQHSVPIRPEGVMRTVEDIRLLNFSKQHLLVFELKLPAIEQNVEMHNREVTFSVTGTFLNLNMFDLEHMVRSSHGNGEENLLFLQTTMAIYDYLLRAKLLAQDTKEKLLSYMDIAYQQLCRYRLDDGSFSMFGDLHECGGVWFTASTIQALQQLSMYEVIPVENALIDDALNWLVEQSAQDGSFNESCSIAHPHIQRTGGKELSLASSVLLAFASRARSREYKAFFNKTLTLLLSSPIDDVYLLAKTTYLLTLIDHPDSLTMLVKLNSIAWKDWQYHFWNVTAPEPTSSAAKRNQEATAYALLANVKHNIIDQEEMIRIAQWIQKHTFACDRCVPSLEKIVALEALGALAHNIPSTVPSVHIEAANHKFDVNATNRELLQSVKLGRSVNRLSVTAKGTGLALIKLSCQYSVTGAVATGTTPTNESNRLPADVTIQKNMLGNQKLVLNLCYFILEPLLIYDSDLWKVAIDLPTGYAVEGLEEHYHSSAKSAIVLDGKSHLEFVWDVRQASKVCFPVTAITRWPYIDVFSGLVYLTSFDTKDVEAVFTF